jgi:GxxExxY protein
MPIMYDGTTPDAGYWFGLMVAHTIIVEITAVEALTPVHHALSQCGIGFLVNFHVALFKQSLRRTVL